jgi:hypothetical protein
MIMIYEEEIYCNKCKESIGTMIWEDHCNCPAWFLCPICALIPREV